MKIVEKSHIWYDDEYWAVMEIKDSKVLIFRYESYEDDTAEIARWVPLEELEQNAKSEMPGMHIRTWKN